MNSNSRIHMIGIGGIGMSALAQYYRDIGYTVSGSDRDPNEAVHSMLARSGVDIVVGHKKENVSRDTDVVVYSDAIVEGLTGYTERESAREKGIREISYFEALGEISRGHYSIAVSGTHGKTTTTGMLAKILFDAHIAPTTIAGSIFKDFGSNYVPGTEDAFLIEACEYKDHLLHLSPSLLVITNIELDHTDWFPNLEAMQNTFRRAVESLPDGGVVVTNPHDPNIAPVLEGVLEKGKIEVVDYTQTTLSDIPQRGFNIQNAQAATSAARVYSEKKGFPLSEESILNSLRNFQGSWRRFELKGKTRNGAEVYDDYAHHPTAVQKTIEMTRERFPDKRIVVLFHPHLYSRTRSLFTEFAEALSTADEVYLLPIYPARECAEDFPGVNSKTLTKAINDISGNASFVDSFDEAERKLAKYDSAHLLITMGAGDVFKVAEKLTE